MSQEMFVVCVQKDSVWIDAAEFDDDDGEFRAFRVCEGLRALGRQAKVVHRWLGANPLAPGEDEPITSSSEHFQSEDRARGSTG